MDVLIAQNPDDRHGLASHLSEAEILSLVDLLQSLRWEEPVEKAKTAGLIDVKSR